MNKTSFHRIAVSWVFVFVLGSLLLSCTKGRDFEKKSSSVVDHSLSSSEASYAYPHPPNWSRGHISFYGAHASALDGTDRDCRSCHNQLKLSAPPLRANCATSCHSQPSTTGRPSPGQPSAVSNDGDYSYPHPVNWSRNHIQFYSLNSRRLENTPRDCKSCHDYLRLDVPRFQATCTTSCHGQSATTGQPLSAQPLASSNNNGGDYSYPHPVDWSRNHIQFYSLNSSRLENTPRDCKSCHDYLQLDVPRFQTTCATSCHSQATATRPTVPPVQQGTTPSSQITLTSQNQRCLSCHQGWFNRNQAQFHGKAGLCVACHNVSDQHFVGGGGRQGVATPFGDQSCYACHSRKDDKSHVHRALTLGKTCSNCHDPHGSSHPAGLRNSVEQTCVACHRNTVPSNSRSVHGIIKNERSCLNCHDPHSSNRAALLSSHGGSEQKCLSCHNQTIQTSAGEERRMIPNIAEKIQNSAHKHAAASNDSSCLKCHKPHASPHEHLMSQSYVSRPFSPYQAATAQRPDTYALCFQCHAHQPSMLNEHIGATETKFRKDSIVDGVTTRVNLHWLHVVDAGGGSNKDHGRTCYTCHDPHGSGQPHIIRSSYSMSPQFQVSVSFTPRSNGGECNRSCHGPKSYTWLPQ